LSTMTSSGKESIDTMLNTARKLEKWDISCSTQDFSSATTIYKVFQDINNATDWPSLCKGVDAGFDVAMSQLLTSDNASSMASTILRTLATLSEVEDVISSRGVGELQEVWAKFEARESWMTSAGYV
jgi:ataxia telangiectasia mutated family protein